MKEARLTIRNATVFTRSGRTRQVAITIKRRKIESVRIEKRGAKIPKGDFDARGRIVLPGLIDCHTHLFALGAEKNYIDLRGTRSIEEMKSRIRAFVQSRGKTTPWIIGRGWSQDLFEEKRFPTKLDLDEAINDAPALMERICGHIGVLNSVGIGVLEERGILSNQGEELVPRGENLEPLGIVKEGVLDACWSALPEATIDDLKLQLIRAQDKALKFGLIGAHCILSDNWRNELKAIASLDRKEKLFLKLSLFLPISALDPIEKMKREKRDSLFKGRRFLVIGFKLFADGSLGGRTAALRDEYADDPGNRGYLYYSDDQVFEFAKRVKRLGVVLATHAIGDRAVEQVLKAYKRARVEKNDGFRIEHCSIVRKDLMRELRSVTLCIQPMFHVSDYWTKDRIGTSGNRIAYPFKTLSKLTKVLGSSDAPVETLDPLKGISAAMNNRRGESLSFIEALKLYTENASSASKLTWNSGRISKGRDADLAILSIKKDNEIAEARVEKTFTNGQPFDFQAIAVTFARAMVKKGPRTTTR